MNNTKCKLFNTLFKISNFFTRNKFLRIVGFPVRKFYLIVVQWIMGIDINDTTYLGENFTIYHGQGLIVHSNTIIGDNVVLRHNTTIGVAFDGGPSPVIGNNVSIGANSVVIGGIKIGDNSIIGAGSVVVNDVPPNVIVVGNPAKIIKTNNNA